MPMPTKRDRVHRSFVEPEGAPPPSANRIIGFADDSHGGCGVCALILAYSDDGEEREIVVTVPLGILLPSGLQATVRATDASGDERRYTPIPEAMEALSADGHVCWALPHGLQSLASLAIDFSYQEGEARICHGRDVPMSESASLAPAAE